jgi:AbrB family looped-hinge helix DNA binding protein
MTTASVSPKFQVTIPKEIHEALQLFSGQCMVLGINDGKIEFVPEQSICPTSGAGPASTAPWSVTLIGSERGRRHAGRSAPVRPPF